MDDGDITSSNGSSRFRCLVLRPEKGGVRDLWRYYRGDVASGSKFLEATEFDATGGAAEEEEEGVFISDLSHRWVIIVSVVAMKLISLFGKPLEYTGFLVDFLLNLLSLNGDLLGLLFNLLRGRVVIPERGTETFISTIGHLDGRIDLYKGERLVGELTDYDADMPEESTTLRAEIGNRALMDLCMMASKLAYENAKVLKCIVVDHWMMHFVEFWDCWNDFQKQMSTQVFIFTEKPTDASLVLISFRGTEPFDADDWISDVDYSWYEIPKLGKVHMGFLEALGLGNRENATTFKNCFLERNLDRMQPDFAGNVMSKASESGDGDKWLPPDMGKKSAYYTVRRRLKSLLSEHKNAKFVVTGHSLGGALAILFPTMLVLHRETQVMQRLLGVYTFGQPRIGDRHLATFMEARLNHPIPRYFRVVYCNDLVPRLPYDDTTFSYKHFGVCLYYDSCYIQQKMEEEPDKNFFSFRRALLVHLNAAWELLRSLTMGYIFGPSYVEGWFSILGRIMGLFLPGVADHAPTDYVNSVRLGREAPVRVTSSL